MMMMMGPVLIQQSIKLFENELQVSENQSFLLYEFQVVFHIIQEEHGIQCIYREIQVASHL